LVERKGEKRPPEVLIARHCKTAWNSEQRLQGSVDLPLSPEGVAEAKSIALRLSGLGITRVITSSYRRASETAQIYADHLQVALHEHPGFREIDHGSWEGRSIPEMLNDPKCGYRQWIGDATSVSIPKSTESIYMAQERCVEALRNVILEYSNEIILVVMHKHIRALLQCALKGISLSEFGRQIDESLDPQKVPADQIERLYQVAKR
jgi:broad specificity phosphatase PhoE